MFSFFKKQIPLSEMIPDQGSDLISNNQKDWHMTIVNGLFANGHKAAYFDWINAKLLIRLGISPKTLPNSSYVTKQMLGLFNTNAAIFYTSYNTDTRQYQSNQHLYEIVLKFNDREEVIDYSCHWIEECRVDNVIIEGVLHKSGEQLGVWLIGNVFTAPLSNDEAASFQAVPLESCVRATVDIRIVLPEEIVSNYFPVEEESFRAYNVRSVEVLDTV